MKQSEAKLGWKEIPIAGVLPEGGTAVEYRSGDWRTFKPIVDVDKCTNCLICWIYCPDASIIRKEKHVEVDYYHCKGCGICAEE
ncbi:TPA: 4Fe-4S dicluster domain-containing protein, partial [Candidatus Bathyarchaeota archaeon]|nr:4Fe-4S dicluster domain-containing protein [Candidatus Bathyarchaeota archaeon]